MKNPHRETVSRLEELPDIGRTMADYLKGIGIDHPRKLIGKDPFNLYEKLSARSGKSLDPCVIDVCMSVINFMEGGDPLPWCPFTNERKSIVSNIDELVKSRHCCHCERSEAISLNVSI